MGRKRNKPQLKGKKESPERVLDETEASKLSDIEFKTMVIRMVKELSENYKELQGSYKELTANYTSMKKDIETISKNQEEMESTVSKMKNTGEEIKSRLDEAEYQISCLEDMVERNSQTDQ